MPSGVVVTRVAGSAPFRSLLAAADQSSTDGGFTGVRSLEVTSVQPKHGHARCHAESMAVAPR